MSRSWVLLIFGISCFAQAPLNPTAFPELPQNIRADLQRRHCKIPQLLYLPNKKVKENVIHGEFAKRGQEDWAVLCETGGTTTILVFWNASEINPTQLAQQKDEVGLAYTTDNRVENIRVISRVGKREIMNSYERFGGPPPPPIDHDGIEDGLAGKASSVNYFHNGKWMGWTSSD